tara:strand:- start:49 stop:486 length:438 start_codon:yes stop_codon:yes gene_type:complete
MTEKITLAGLSAKLKEAKQEVKDQKARAAKQMAEFRKEMRSQRSAMLGLIKDGKVSADVNKIDNNQNKNRSTPKPKQGPKEPTKEELRLQKIRDKVKKAKATKRLSGRGGGGTMTPIKPQDRTGLSGPLRRKMNKGGSVKKKAKK